jgi:hypothetical protein
MALHHFQDRVKVPEDLELLHLFLYQGQDLAQEELQDHQEEIQEYQDRLEVLQEEGQPEVELQEDLPHQEQMEDYLVHPQESLLGQIQEESDHKQT